MKKYYFKCIGECQQICCLAPIINEIEKIKYFYDKVPFIFKISVFNEDYFQRFNDNFFKNLTLDSLIRVNFNKKFIYINTGLNFSMPGSQCPFLKNEKCQIFLQRPLKCKLFPLQEYLPFSWQYKALENLKTTCLGIGKGEFLINKSGTKINNEFFNNYISYWKNSKEWNNFSTTLKNIEIVLNHYYEDLEEKIFKHKIPVIEYITIYKTDKVFFKKTNINEKDYNEKQKNLIMNDTAIPTIFKSFYN